MPMIARGLGEFQRRRILISGRPNTGKTWSIFTFDEEDKSLVVLACPGETGTHSLAEDTGRITSYYFENASEEDRRTVTWCKDAMNDFDKAYKEVERNKPDKLFIDGAHNLFEIPFNVITNGMYFEGKDLKSGRNAYEAADLYRRGHTLFGNRLKTYYDSAIPFIGVTTWERLIGATVGDEGGSGNTIGIGDDRYYWPSLPGEMAMRVVGFFDARISARLCKQCVHTTCEASKRLQLHHVWQFYPKNDVMGVGIKGLKMIPAYIDKPWVHQEWPALRSLLKKTD